MILEGAQRRDSAILTFSTVCSTTRTGNERMICRDCGRPYDAWTPHCAGCGSSLPTRSERETGDTGDADAAHQPSVPSDDTQGSPARTHSTFDTFLPADSAAMFRPAGPFSPGRKIANRYVIVKPIGVGGMGAVYQAWDEKVDISIALKVIRPPEPTDDPRSTEDRRRRFRQELVLARQVTHKNVVRIHDLGDIDGVPYLTMPYVHGANLARILAREGTLPVPRVLRIARQVASGLAAAHEAGIVHRDLKPANVMIEEDTERALIMDFGIARSMSESVLTRTGAVVGTFQYMAPEQAEGRQVDQRCDVYAFGLVVYELLTGARAPSPLAAAGLRWFDKPLASVRSLNPAVPAPLAAVVERCLAHDVDARYRSGTELVAALDALDDSGESAAAVPQRRLSPAAVRTAILTATLAALAAAGVVYRARSGGEPTPRPHDPVSVLIADFDNRANDPVFDGSIEQALTIGIEGAPFITTYPRTGARAVAKQLANGTLDDAAARLISMRDGVRFVLTGSVQTDADGYVISVNLIDPTVARPLKTETTRARTKADVLSATGRLSASLRRDLGDMTSESARLAASETFTTSSLEAVREYTAAQNLANNSQDEDAIVHYKKAVEADPNFGRAYSGWAVSDYNVGKNEEAAAHWRKALSLIDRMTDRERYRTLGAYYLSVAHSYDQAVDNYTQLVKLYPSDRAGHNNLALAYFNQLNFDKAREEGRKALDIYKGSLKFRNNLALYAMYAGDFTSAASDARQLLAAEPKFSDAYFPLATALAVEGDRPAARAVYERMASTNEAGASRAAMGLADIAMYEGRFDDAVPILVRSLPADEKAGNTLGLSSKYVALAEAYLALGQPAKATEAARKATAIMRLESVLVPVARVLSAAGQAGEAALLSAELNNQVPRQTRAYARIIDGEIAIEQNRPADAIESLRAAQRQFDLWLAHLDLGIAYVRAGHFAEALSEFDQ